MGNSNEENLLGAIELIAHEYIDSHNPNNDFNKQIRDSAARSMKAAAIKRENLLAEKNLYYETIENYIEENSDLKKIYRLPLDLYSPLSVPELEHSDHVLRKAEERYLIKQLDISDAKDSIKNWALIGMALAANRKDAPNTILFKEEWSRQNKGRPSKGLSIDYERAVWRLMVNSHAVELAEKKAAILNEGQDEYKFVVTLYTLTELLDAYIYAFENPDKHEYLWVFEQLEEKLKIRFKSRSSLLTSFNRGEKERATK